MQRNRAHENDCFVLSVTYNLKWAKLYIENELRVLLTNLLIFLLYSTNVPPIRQESIQRYININVY